MKITNRDLILLSAYLDGELTAEERTALEVRFQEEKRLSEALKKLAQTRKALRTVPRLTAPRNFSLTPAMVGGQDAQGWLDAFRMLRLASALAAVLLLAVLIYDFGSVFVPAALRNAAPPAAMEEAVSLAEDQAEGAVPTPQPEEELETMAEMEAPEAEKTTQDGEEFGEQGDLAGQQKEQPEQPQEEAERVLPAEEETAQEGPDPSPAGADTLLVLEIVLALSAAGLGAGAYLARKKTQ